MPYSLRLMTFIFIKRHCDPGPPTETTASRRRPGGGYKQAVMRTELQRWGGLAVPHRVRQSAGSVVSTLSLCNANFSRG